MEGFRRPPVRVLPDEALVPEKNVISPPPSTFTHRLNRTQKFFFEGSARDRAADGELPEGTLVSLIADSEDGRFCRVVDRHGLSVVTERNGLEPLGSEP